MTEIWKPIKGYEGIYEVSSYGRVRSHDRILKDFRTRKPYIKKGKIEHMSIKKDGYLQVSLYCDGKGTTKGVHRLVAEAFIPNPDNLPQVNHKDENKQNNHVENLEWCTVQYNCRYNDRHIKIGRKVHETNLRNKGIRK